MPKSVADMLMERRAQNITRAQEIAQVGVVHGRDLSVNEQTEFDGLIAEAEKLSERAKAIAEGENRAHDLEDSFRDATGQSRRRPAEGRAVHPLAAMPLNAVADLSAAVKEGRTFRWTASGEEQRAALTTGTYGTATNWVGFAADGPAVLHVIGGAQTQILDGLGMSFPTWTLPTAQASVGENAAMTEYSNTTGGTITAARFGRWTDLSKEAALNGTLGVMELHRMGIAKDLNANLVDKIETAAGTPLVFATSAEYMARLGIATVADATAAEATDMVIIVNPADAPLLQDVAATNSDDQASVVQRFAGSKVFASGAQAAGVAVVANLKVGVVFGSAQEYTVDSLIDPKTGTFTVGSSLIGGYGIGIPDAAVAVALAA